MADVVDPATRSRMMAGIRGKDTRPEFLVRRGLHSAGFRYRLHHQGLPGRPDIVLPRYHAAIFIHGCFWHRHSGCRFATTPATRSEFWQRKFDDNVARDQKSVQSLLHEGWRVALVWECALRADQARILLELAEWLRSGVIGMREFGGAGLGYPTEDDSLPA